MNAKYAVFTLVLFASVAGISAGKWGKMDKIKHLTACYTAESLKTKGEQFNATVQECLKEVGSDIVIPTEAAAVTGAPPAGDKKGMKHQHKPNFCFLECTFKKYGLIKDGSFAVEEYAKTDVKSEHQKAFVKEFNACLTKHELTASYTSSKDDQCKGIKKHAECFKKATKVCLSKEDTNGSSTAAPASSEGSEDSKSNE